VGADFDDSLTTPQIEDHIRAIEQRVREQHGEVTGIFVRPEDSGQRGDEPFAPLERLSGAPS
jgi:hypothetical protein